MTPPGYIATFDPNEGVNGYSGAEMESAALILG